MLKKQTKTVGIVVAATAALGVGLFLTSRSSPSGSATAHAAPVAEMVAPAEIATAREVVRPRIDVVFALDTTSSMSGMIAGAKEKIWSLANEIASGQPRPIVRFGLVAFRDKGDAYVTKVTGLSSDMDAMYDELMGFQAQGGGDGPEHVNQALADSLDKMQWGQGPKVLRIVFLVGDAPPHNDYNDGLSSTGLAKKAAEMGIVINTIRTGNDPNTGREWQRIASLAGGQFHSISQNGAMVAIATPYDAKLVELNRVLADTSIGYGSHDARRKMRSKKSNRYAMSAEVAASAASYSSKKPSAGLGRGDLLEGLESGAISMDSLDGESLSEELRDLSSSERKSYIKGKKVARQAAQKKLKQLSKDRDSWIKKNTKKDKDSMDGKMMGAVKEQAAELGVSW
ncbi:MAG: VWA domain-containing protein [Kofleriaceae bacterium]|nr:VWA domain-containing protein [Kofleriaceae bacterium]